MKFFIAIIFMVLIVSVQGILDKHKTHIEVDQNSPTVLKADPSIYKYLTFGFDSMINDLLLISTTLKMISVEESSEYKLINEDDKVDLYQELGILNVNLDDHEDHHHDHDHKTKTQIFLEKLGFVFEDHHHDHHDHDDHEDDHEDDHHDKDELSLEQREAILQDILYYLMIASQIEPQYYGIYDQAFVIFSILNNRPDLAEALLLEGVKQNPSDVKFYFLLATNSIFHLYKLDQTKEYLTQQVNDITSIEDRTFMTNLINRLDKLSNPYLLKLRFLQSMQEKLKKVSSEKALLKQIDDLSIQVGLFELNKRVPDYKNKKGTYPNNVNQMTDSFTFDSFSTKIIELNSNSIQFDQQEKAFIIKSPNIQKRRVK